MALEASVESPIPNIDKVRQRNNFDFLRLFAASAVIITHCYPLTGRPEGHDPLTQLNGNLSFSFIGLRIFFFISGFLIAQSLLRSNSIIEYLWKRVLRIIPGLFVALTLSIVLLGPLVTELPISEYFRSTMTWTYYKNISLYLMHYDLPGVFTHNPYAQPVNGSLWTLMYEFTFYILLLAFSLIGGLKNKWLAVLAFAAALSLRIYFQFYPYYFDTWYPIGITNLNLKFTLDFGLYFLAGTVLTFFRKKISFTLSTLLGAVIVYAILLQTPVAQLASYLALPIIILSIAFAPKLKFLNGAGMFGDFSYGMYIYAFPVQQTLVYFYMKLNGGQIALGWMVLLSILLTLPFAVLSWHFVEKPFLKLKRKIQS